MAVMTTNRAASLNLGGLFHSLVSAFVAWNDARATRRALSKLSDRELDDIGLCRGDIDLIAGRY